MQLAVGFLERLQGAWAYSNSLVCVGLDTDLQAIPNQFRSRADGILAFNQAIIDATADVVCAYKPQIAYYSAQRAEDQLIATIRYIKDRYPQIPVILDAKRGDIGATAEMYAREAFDVYGADAVTVNPYMGTDSLRPFLDRADKGVIILCKTSNAGGEDFQSLTSEGRKIYQRVAEKAANEWNSNRNVALVVGATFPAVLRDVRTIVGEMPLLVPGIGAQGGDLTQTILQGQDSQGLGLMINSSRGVLYSSSGTDFAEASRKVVLGMNAEINKLRHRD